jgi:hypothetical protein
MIKLLDRILRRIRADKACIGCRAEKKITQQFMRPRENNRIQGALISKLSLGIL